MSGKQPRTVLLTGPDAFGNLKGIEAAFAGLDWEVITCPDSFPATTFQRKFWALTARLGVRARFEAARYNRFLCRRVLPLAARERPGLLLFLLPYRLTAAMKDAVVSLKTPVVTWATDSLKRYGTHSRPWDFAVRNYVFDGGDVGRGLKTCWLPLGFDESVFRPTKEITWDLLFVGRLFSFSYPTRIRFLERLISSDLPRRFRVAMAGAMPRQLESMKARMETSGLLWLGELSIMELANSVARSKIAISIHQDDGNQPVNPMFFAIPGSGACLVTDQRDYLGEWLVEGREFIPASLDSFLVVLNHLLEDEQTRGELARNGHAGALAHTWKRRVERILDDVGLSGCDISGGELT